MGRQILLQTNAGARIPGSEAPIVTSRYSNLVGGMGLLVLALLGIENGKVTSITQILGYHIPMEQVSRQVIKTFAKEFNCEIVNL